MDVVWRLRLVSGWGLQKWRSAPPYGPLRLRKGLYFTYFTIGLYAGDSRSKIITDVLSSAKHLPVHQTFTLFPCEGRDHGWGCLTWLLFTSLFLSVHRVISRFCVYACLTVYVRMTWSVSLWRGLARGEYIHVPSFCPSTIAVGWRLSVSTSYRLEWPSYRDHTLIVSARLVCD